jgi:hypothetical protein
MKDSEIPASVLHQTYPSAAQGLVDSRKHAISLQTQSASYQLAFADDAFLLRDEMRGVRLQLEFQKPDLIQIDEGIESTIVVFGGARVLEPEAARARLREAEEGLAERPDDAEAQAKVARARRLVASSQYYEEARELARLASTSCHLNGHCHFVVATGGGPGIMEAANRGAHDCGAKSIGHNIVLPHEQAPNPYITPELCFQFHYFALRKMHFLMRAKALICFPGGYGTMDELFEALTLIQTGKIEPIPVILVGREFWERVIDFHFLVEEGFISTDDVELFRIVETGAEAWWEVCRFYSLPL